jgi:hypothetical protein
MIQTISWTEYFLLMSVATAGYYGWWVHRYFPGVWFAWRGKQAATGTLSGWMVWGPGLGPAAFGLAAMAAGMMTPGRLWAQDGNAGINQANTLIRGYFDTGVTLMYAIGALLGLIGAVRVYQKWSHGDHDTGKVAAAWFGSCVFLVVVATVIRQFFGL